MENLNNRNITPDDIESGVEVPRKSSGTFNQKNYLDVKLGANEETKELKIRLLTADKDTNSPFRHIYMHNVKVPTEIAPSGWKNYVCLSKTEGAFSESLGHKCPFCELRNKAYKKSLEATTEVEKKRWQEISCANIPNEVSVLRCIERGKEEEGPKFWKFNLKKDKTDAENLIRSLYATRKKESLEEGDEVPMNILDIDNGKDLLVTITAVRDSNGKLTKKTGLKITDYGKQHPLTTDIEQRNAWIMDKKVWSDVFVAKPYEYLELVMKGEVPYYDKTQNKWVSKSETTEKYGEEKAEKMQQADDEIREAMKAASTVTTRNNNETQAVTTVNQMDITDVPANIVTDIPF